MTAFRVSLLAVLVAQYCFPANLAVSTYFKDGFTPIAIASDGQGNVFVVGSAVIDPLAQTTGVAVAKLDPKASRYLYLAYLDSAASDQVSAIAVDSAGNAYVTGWTVNPNFPSVGGGSLGTAPTGSQDQRSFVTKLSPDGAVVFSVLIGGSLASQALGIAITPQGQILVSAFPGASASPSG
ncbi:MAG: SBBP repeat-containing protein [Bryobacteraceae bacterium]